MTDENREASENLKQKHVIAHTYIYEPLEAQCFQYDGLPLNRTIDRYPVWFREKYETGQLDSYYDKKRDQHYLQLNDHKRTKGEKCFPGDWISRDEFKLIRVQAQSKFNKRLTLKSKLGD